MRDLKVALNYVDTDVAPAESPLALPLRVLDAEGGLIAEGVTANQRPAEFRIPDTEAPVFVRLTWPSGKTETKRAVSDSVIFDNEQVSKDKWSAWAVPLLNKNSLLARKEPAAPEAGIDSFNQTWLRLWQLKNGYWSDIRIAPTNMRRNDLAVQLDLDLDKSGWCLQLGGPKLAWRMVLLPGSGRCRVLITPNQSDDPRAESLKVVVTGFRRDAEMLLEFMSRDAWRAANSVATYDPLAVALLSKKFSDPIAAAAGGYFLLRTQGWSGIPVWWFDNLCNEFPWLPDGAILRCIVMLRAGLTKKEDETAARDLLSKALDRGFPVFAEGLSLLQEATSLLHRRADRGSIFSTVEKLAASQVWAGAALSYLGGDPSSPSPVRIFGVPQKTSLGQRKKKGVTVARSRRPPDSVLLLENVR